MSVVVGGCDCGGGGGLFCAVTYMLNKDMTRILFHRHCVTDVSTALCVPAWHTDTVFASPAQVIDSSLLSSTLF